jgi:hypothetical protein
MLGVTSLTRSSLLPEVPTIAEQGLPGYEAVLRYGLVAPAGISRTVVTGSTRNCVPCSQVKTSAPVLRRLAQNRFRQLQKSMRSRLIEKR